MTEHRTSDGDTAYLEAGSGVPLVLLHGFPLSKDLWRPQIAALSSVARVLAPDLRGFEGPRLRDFARMGNPDPGAFEDPGHFGFKDGWIRIKAGTDVVRLDRAGKRRHIHKPLGHLLLPLLEYGRRLGCLRRHGYPAPGATPASRAPAFSYVPSLRKAC